MATFKKIAIQNSFILMEEGFELLYFSNANPNKKFRKASNKESIATLIDKTEIKRILEKNKMYILYFIFTK